VTESRADIFVSDQEFLVTIKFEARVPASRNALYRMIWRWHFYAGLFVIPFILILSITGAIYLFKPQIDAWEESRFVEPSQAVTVSADQQVDAALRAFPGARFDSYRLPERQGDVAMVHIALADGQSMRDVFVSPRGKVLGSFDPENRIIAFVGRIHSELLIGRYGSWIVELAASWAIVMMLTGLYLWWPQRGGLAGVVWPRLRAGRRVMWRDLHAVTGFWVSSFALILLVTAMPWANVWGEGFKMVRAELGWQKGKQDWKTAGEHVEHDHRAMLAMAARGQGAVRLSAIVAKAKREQLAFPVMISPPGETMVWTAKSQAQNRPLRASITYDMMTGAVLSREGFGDKHVIDRAVGYGIAWHEGQLFGWINQLIGLFTALALITLMVTGFIMWRRRKPEGVLGAPAALPVRIRGAVVLLLLLAALLPLLAASLIVLLFLERLVLPRLPALSRWLGLATWEAAH
jgi:uncharacterized iron-regulated membrane protein